MIHGLFMSIGEVLSSRKAGSTVDGKAKKKREGVMYNKRIVSSVVLIAFLISSCASYRIDQGVEAFNRGNYSLAAHHWNGPAKEGNPAAENNLGVLWEYGLGKTPKNLNQAATWYVRAAKKGHLRAMTNLARVQKQLGYEEAAVSWITLAARWGDEKAKNMLQEWNKPVPNADLLQQQVAENERRDQEVGDALGMMLILGLTAAGAAAAKNSGRTVISPNVEPLGVSGTASGGCTSDFNCGYGFKCVKALYKNHGVCMKSVDSYGVPDMSGPSRDSIGVKTAPGCNFNTDCPVGFRCDANLKACVK